MLCWGHEGTGLALRWSSSRAMDAAILRDVLGSPKNVVVLRSSKTKVAGFHVFITEGCDAKRTSVALLVDFCTPLWLGPQFFDRSAGGWGKCPYAESDKYLPVFRRIAASLVKREGRRTRRL